MKTNLKISGSDLLVLPALIALSISLTACSGNSNVAASSADDSSASGIAASSIGGALSASGSGGTQAANAHMPKASHAFSAVASLLQSPPALAGNFCPTFKFSSGSGCTASGSEMWLSYDSCTFSGKTSWTGVQALTMSAGSAACGSFPNPGASGTLYRQAVSAVNGNTPGQWTLTSGANSVVVDDAKSNLGNFDGQTISPITNGGYGVAISFNASGARSAVNFAHRISQTGSFDHSVNGSLQITETAGASSRNVSGQVTVYHNLLRVIGTSVLSSVVHNDICCLPVSGSIKTTFSAGANVSPSALGAAAVGKSETLTFTGCGTATLQSYDGSTTNVSLSRCI